MKDVLILGLGNDLVADDGFGPEVIKRLKQRPDLSERVELIFAPLAGFALLDLMRGKRVVLIVDSILTGKSPAGTLHYFPAGFMTPTKQLSGSHQISLPTALELGKLIGYEMPLQIDVLAVEASDVLSITEELTAPVEAALASAILQIDEWIEAVLKGRNHEHARIAI